MKLSPALQPLARVFNIPIRPSTRPLPPLAHQSLTHPSRTTHPSNLFQTHPFSTTPIPLARSPNQPKRDRRITLIRYHLNHPLTPRPLRLSRLRALRHWTIHRAWQLQRYKDYQSRQLELERQYNAMRAACEELRLGVDDGGRLYRQAMSRKGLFGGVKMEGGFVGNGGIPPEYARGQTEGPGRGGWDEGWTR